MDKAEKIKKQENDRTEMSGKSFFKNKKWSILFQFVADNIAFASTFLIFYLFIFESGAVERRGIPEQQLILVGLGLVNLYWSLAYFFAGLYKNWYERSPFDEYFLILKTALVGTALIYLLVIFDTDKPPRMMVIYFFLLLFVSSSLLRTLIRRLQRHLRRKRVISSKTLVIGKLENISKAIEKMDLSPSWGLLPIGGVRCDTDAVADGDILGSIESLPEIIKEYKPDVLVITKNDLGEDNLFRVLNLCSEYNIRTKIEPDLYSIFTGHTKTHNIYGIPYMEINPNLMSSWELFGKRLFDIIFSSAVILIGMPVWLLVALIITLESRGGIFYTQPRVGLNSREFRMWKFRSMVSGADKLASWTRVGDSRVTAMGKFIRKTHLDEIPQFWNVLIGDMSVVGPRPEQPKFVKEFSEEFPFYKRRLVVRPGITGWWQVNYKPHELNSEEIKGRLKEDFYYIENMSLKFDIEIIFRTVWAVLSGHGQS